MVKEQTTNTPTYNAGNSLYVGWLCNTKCNFKKKVGGGGRQKPSIISVGLQIYGSWVEKMLCCKFW